MNKSAYVSGIWNYIDNQEECKNYGIIGNDSKDGPPTCVSAQFETCSLLVSDLADLPTEEACNCLQSMSTDSCNVFEKQFLHDMLNARESCGSPGLSHMKDIAPVTPGPAIIQEKAFGSIQHGGRSGLNTLRTYFIFFRKRGSALHETEDINAFFDVGMSAISIHTCSMKSSVAILLECNNTCTQQIQIYVTY